MTDLRSVPDEIGWGDDREGRRRLPGWMSPHALRRRLPRWVLPVVVALAVVAAAGIVVVPRVADHFAGDAAARVQTAWQQQTDLDTLRIAAIRDVTQRAGLADSPVLARAVRHADAVAVETLKGIRARVDDGRAWRGDVAGARGAVLAAIGAHIRLFEADRVARSPDDGFLYDSEYGALTERADRLVAGLIRHYHLPTHQVRRFRLPPLTAELDLLSRSVDVPTGLRLVLGGRGTLWSYDLDSGRSTSLLHVGGRPVAATLPNGEGFVRASGESIAVYRPGRAAERTGPFSYPQVVGRSTDGFWVAEVDRLRWYDAAGRPAGSWYDVPLQAGFVVAGAGDTLVLQGSIGPGSTETGAPASATMPLSVWDPHSARVTPLGDFCPIANVAAAADVVVIVDCGRHGAVEVYDARTGRLTARHDLPARTNRWDLRLSPDGRMLTFGRNSLTTRVRVMELATGEVAEVPTRLPAEPVTWSPDGRWLLVVRANETAGPQNDTYGLWDTRAGRLYSVRLALEPSFDVPATLVPVRP